MQQGPGGVSAGPRLCAVAESKSTWVHLVGPAFTKSMNLAYGRMEPPENLLEVEENPCLPLKKSGRTQTFQFIDCGLRRPYLPSGRGFLWSLLRLRALGKGL